VSVRTYLDRLNLELNLVRIQAEISKQYEVAGVLKKLEPYPVLFDQVQDSPFRIAGNLLCTKDDFARYFGIPISGIIPLLTHAIEHPIACTPYTSPTNPAPCQEVVLEEPSLDDLPVLLHCAGDGGPYISSGVVIASHPDYGQNADFHRCMQFSSRQMAVRVVQGRHFDRFLNDQQQVDIAICVGCPPNVLVAAATSVDLGVNELEIAAALEPLEVVKAYTVDLLVPAEAEFVLEGTVYLDRRHAEGPFVDLTGTQDIVRLEPVFELKAVTHRRQAIWHALLPGGLEHKLLMGMPREPTIFKKVNEVVKCLDVNVNPGGCSWLHAIVRIEKQTEEDGKKAIQAAFAGHSSCKHVFVVDADIDIYNPLEVEWAMATRFQGDADLVVIGKERGSSLDPSAEAGTHLTTKLGFDLTKPLTTAGKAFERVSFPEVDLDRFLER
jgi:2,5-furandicarboxylate decarboxylase 1